MKMTNSFEKDINKSRNQWLKLKYSPDNIYSYVWVSYIVVVIFILTDFFCLYTTWDQAAAKFITTPFFGGIYYLNWFTPRTLICISSAIGLDVPMAIAAIALKKYLYNKDKKNINSKIGIKLIMYSSIIGFLIIFIANFVLRLAFYEEFQGVKTVKIMSACALGIIPLVTSISSFVISYFSYDPIKIEKAKLNRIKNGLEEQMIMLQKAQSEAIESKSFGLGLLIKEEEDHKQFTGVIDDEEDRIKQISRIVQEELMKSADETTEIIESGKKAMKSVDCGIDGKYKDHVKELF